MTSTLIAVLPAFAFRDLWRWIMLVLGILVIAHGLLSRHMRVREGLWRGKVVKKRWQIVLMRSWFVLIGLAIAAMAFTAHWPLCRIAFRAITSRVRRSAGRVELLFRSLFLLFDSAAESVGLGTCLDDMSAICHPIE